VHSFGSGLMKLIGSSPSRARAFLWVVNVHVSGSALMQRHNGAAHPPPFLGVNTQNNDSQRSWCRLFWQSHVRKGPMCLRTVSGRNRRNCGRCPQFVRNYEQVVFSEVPDARTSYGHCPKIRCHHGRRASLNSSSSRSASSRLRSSCSLRVLSATSVISRWPSKRPNSRCRVSPHPIPILLDALRRF
jgi:hypothetical protein